jgi:hypothetical protein
LSWRALASSWCAQPVPRGAMAHHTALAAVSRSLRRLLVDRMVTGTAVTLAPTELEGGAIGACVNLDLFQVTSAPPLANQPPPHGHPAGSPPLALTLRYLVTTRGAIDGHVDADVESQAILGDVMRVLHAFGAGLSSLVVTNPAAGVVGEPILDPVLRGEGEALRVTLSSNTEDLTRAWLARSEKRFRRAVVYEVGVVRIASEPQEP